MNPSRSVPVLERAAARGGAARPVTDTPLLCRVNSSTLPGSFEVADLLAQRRLREVQRRRGTDHGALTGECMNARIRRRAQSIAPRYRSGTVSTWTQDRCRMFHGDVGRSRPAIGQERACVSG